MAEHDINELAMTIWSLPAPTMEEVFHKFRMNSGFNPTYLEYLPEAFFTKGSDKESANG